MPLSTVDHEVKLRPYAPAMIWGAFLLFLGGRSDVPTVRLDLPLDKAAHFLLYGVLGALAGRGWKDRWPAWYWPLAFAWLIGALDEIHQRTVPGRMADPFDWVADVVGASLGFLLVVRAQQRRRNR